MRERRREEEGPSGPDARRGDAGGEKGLSFATAERVFHRAEDICGTALPRPRPLKLRRPASAPALQQRPARRPASAPSAGRSGAKQSKAAAQDAEAAAKTPKKKRPASAGNASKKKYPESNAAFSVEAALRRWEREVLNSIAAGATFMPLLSSTPSLGARLRGCESDGCLKASTSKSKASPSSSSRAHGMLKKALEDFYSTQQQTEVKRSRRRTFADGPPPVSSPAWKAAAKQPTSPGPFSGTDSFHLRSSPPSERGGRAADRPEKSDQDLPGAPFSPSSSRSLSVGSIGSQASNGPALGDGETPTDQAESAGPIELPRMLPWEEHELAAAYKASLREDETEILVDDLAVALNMLGVKYVDEQGIGDLVRQQTRYTSLDYEEFLQFFKNYQDWEMHEMYKIFTEADKDDSGTIDLNELHALVNKMGYAATRQTVLDIMSVNRDCSGQVVFDEFQLVMHHLRCTSGIARQDLEDYCEAFTKVAGARENRLPLEEIWRLLIFFGYPASREEMADLALMTGCINEGGLSFREFLKVVRAYRDKAHSGVLKLLQDYGRDDIDPGRVSSLRGRRRASAGFLEQDLTHANKGQPRRIALEDLGMALSDLGYHLSGAAARETLEELGELEEESALTLEELACFVRRYRMSQGFTKAEVAELRVAFNIHSHETSPLGFDRRSEADFRPGKHLGEESPPLGVLAVGEALRWQGFTLPLPARQRAVREVDMDGSGKLEFIEFLKLMSRLHTREAAKRHRVFCHFMSGGRGRLEGSRVLQAMKHVFGLDPDPQLLAQAVASYTVAGISARSSIDSQDSELPEIAEEEFDTDEGAFDPSAPVLLPDVDASGFESLCAEYFRLAACEARSHAGHSAQEVAVLRKRFEAMDRKGQGSIERAELRELLASAFPEASRSSRRREWLRQLLQRADANQNGALEFDEFLWLTRAADDARDAADLVEEARVLERLGLSLDELDEYRELFIGKADMFGEVDFAVVLEMLSFAEFDHEQVERLAGIASDVAGPRVEKFRFPEFLKLVEAVCADEALGVRQAALRVARAEVVSRRWDEAVQELHVKCGKARGMVAVR